MKSAELLSSKGPFASSLIGYEQRDSQLQMASAVEAALRYKGILLLEAATGTGKTLAYTVPALCSGKRVVISTATKTLQDQLYFRDIPLVKEVLGLDVPTACVKGLTNYLCLRRWQEYLQSQVVLDSTAGLISEWMHRTVTGDYAELAGLQEHSAVWSSINSSAETRIGPRCDHYESCFITRLRRAAEESQIIVTNHHLFFADLAMRDARRSALLPDYDAVIFDEAHRIEEIATEFFGVEVSTHRFEVFVRDARRIFASAKIQEQGELALRSVERAVANLFTSLNEALNRDLRPHDSGAKERVGKLTLSSDMTARALPYLLDLDNALDQLAALCASHAHLHETAGGLAKRAHALRDALHMLSDPPRSDYVVWMEHRNRNLLLGSSPIDVGHIFREKVLEQVDSVICTSATLATSGTFEFLKQRLGIEHEIDEHILESPFDYASQVLFYVPAEIPEPSSNAFTEHAAEQVERLISVTAGGAFVLCTSHKAVASLSRHCKASMQKEILVQGQAPKMHLLSRFRDNGNAVLFGAESFWEGVDVPGAALRLVVMDRLPFDVPTDPLVLARCERLKMQGLQPFVKYQLPSAALTLKQGFGRLIRRRTDRGIIAVLDRRLISKGYGKVLLRNLPVDRVITDFGELQQAWATLTSVCPQTSEAQASFSDSVL